MGAIKNSLSNRDSFTLAKEEMEFLKQTAAFFQAELERIQQSVAVNYLKQVAVSRFEYDPNDALEFSLDMATGKLDIVVVDK